MIRLPLDKLQTGMVLAEDLRNDSGRFLLAKGTELEDKHLRVFRIWGLFEVPVDGSGEPDEVPADIPPDLLQKAEAVTRARFFANDPDHPALAGLRQFCCLRLAKALAADPRVLKPATRIDDETRAELNKKLPAPDTTPLRIVRSQTVELGTIPGLLNQLTEIINSPRSSSSDISKVVQRDPSLTARLLKIVNSPFYGFPTKIDTISRAVTVVGSRQLTTLAVGVMAIDTFRDIPALLMDMETFWRHSLYCGFCARILAGYTPTSSPERFFVAGLLHDIGRLLFFRYYPKESAALLYRAYNGEGAIHTLEKEFFGFDHARLGAALLKEWSFPAVLETAVSCHENPAKCSYLPEANVVHLADIVACALEDTRFPDMKIPPMDLKAWEEMNLPDSAMARVAEQADSLFRQTAGVFLSHG